MRWLKNGNKFVVSMVTKGSRLRVEGQGHMSKVGRGIVDYGVSMATIVLFYFPLRPKSRCVLGNIIMVLKIRVGRSDSFFTIEIARKRVPALTCESSGGFSKKEYYNIVGYTC